MGRDSPGAVELELRSGGEEIRKLHSGGEELLTTEQLMDAGRRSTVGREVCLLELAAYCRSRLVQSCLLEEDLLGGDCYCVAETSTAAAGKRRLLLVLPLQLGIERCGRGAPAVAAST